MTIPDEMEIEVFRAGDYGPKGNWSGDDLGRMAADYNPALHEAPVTIDHAQSGPAHGWVAALRHAGDRLFARLRSVSEALREQLRSGAFKKRSVELYPSLRETGRPYLRAVSFLGAAVPEVKGLADPLPDFSETPTDGTAATPLFKADPSAWHAFDQPFDGASPEPIPPPSALAVDFADLAARLRRLGKWHPAWESAGIAAFVEALNRHGTVMPPAGDVNSNDNSAAAPPGEHPAVWFARFLEQLPPVVHFGELAAHAGRSLTHHALPPAENLDPASIRRHEAALAFMESHPEAGYGEALLNSAN